MESLSADLLLLFRLQRRDAAKLAATSKTMNALVTEMWCADGIAVSQRIAMSTLRQRGGTRWTPLKKLHIWSLWHPQDVRYQWTTFPIPLPRLEELYLEKTTQPSAPWADIIASLPSLHTLCITTRLSTTSTSNLSGLKDAILAAAPKVKTLKITCEGLVVYIRGTPLGLEENAFFHNVKALYSVPMTVSDTLQTYHNTGQQLATIGVDAPLQELFLEEGDQGPRGFANIGPRCNETLKILRLKALETRLPHGVRCRFPNVVTTDLRVSVETQYTTLCEWLINEAPLSTQDLQLHIDVSPFLPDRQLVWNPECLRALPHLRTVNITCSHTCLGASSILSCIEYAPPALHAFTLVTKHRAIPDQDDDTRFCTEWSYALDQEWVESLRKEEFNCYVVTQTMQKLRPGVKIRMVLAIS